jgi:hypothetical protein
MLYEKNGLALMIHLEPYLLYNKKLSVTVCVCDMQEYGYWK